MPISASHSDGLEDNSDSNLSTRLDLLRVRYLDIINAQLPQKAKQVAMPVQFSHCFARIVLDNLFQACWYEHLSRKKPAYKQLNEAQLLQAIEIAHEMLVDVDMAKLLNQKSLRWRGKSR